MNVRISTLRSMIVFIRIPTEISSTNVNYEQLWNLPYVPAVAIFIAGVALFIYLFLNIMPVP